MQRWLAAVLILGVASTSAASQGQPALPSDSLERGRKFSRWFKESNVDSLWEYIAPTAREGPFASKTALATASNDMQQRAGLFLPITEERFAWRGGNRQYWQAFGASEAPGPVLLRWVLNAEGKVTGLGLGLAADAPPVDSGGAWFKRP